MGRLDGGPFHFGGLMADEPKNPALPDIHPGNVAPVLCKQLGVPGCIVITSLEDGSMMMIAHGVNHLRAAEMLTRGTQINMNQHDEWVRQGAAGEVAQEHQQLLDKFEAAVVGSVQ
jgi:hypothetical protein